MSDAKKVDNKPKSDGDYYTKLKVYPGRRKFLALASAGFYVFCFSLLVTAMVTKAPWMVTAMPVVIAGLVFCFVPATEDWSYKPWQSNTRQYEKHQIER
jgi:hypothetical protein